MSDHDREGDALRAHGAFLVGIVSAPKADPTAALFGGPADDAPPTDDAPTTPADDAGDLDTLRRELAVAAGIDQHAHRLRGTTRQELAADAADLARLLADARADDDDGTHPDPQSHEAFLSRLLTGEGVASDSPAEDGGLFDAGPRRSIQAETEAAHRRNVAEQIAQAARDAEDAEDAEDADYDDYDDRRNPAARALSRFLRPDTQAD